MRIILFSQDDCAVSFLSSLASLGHDVVGIDSDGSNPGFAQRCIELGFDFISSRQGSAVKTVLESFGAHAVVYFPFSRQTSCYEFDVGSAAIYQVHMGCGSSAAPWPEFVPIFNQWKESFVSVTSQRHIWSAVSITSDETAISLRQKHVEEVAHLLHEILLDSGLQSTHGTPPASTHEDIPAKIDLHWEREVVDRFVRARCLPPNDPAEAEDPSTGQVYLIENMMQFDTFCAEIAANGSRDTTKHEKQLYVADTHWYSNAGGSIVKVCDSNIHVPRKKVDKANTMAIPGAVVAGARQKLRMNEPFIGTNTQRYCSSALASSWIGVEGPFIKKFEGHLARICGCTAACAVQSGTSALYGAIKALGVTDPSHHVLVPSFTCAAAADAVVHAGGTPIPIDCELETYGCSTDSVRSNLTPNVVGVCIAHCYGVPIRDFAEIAALCRERGIWLLEDACESYGATMFDRARQTQVPVGSLATLSVVSVRSEKMVGVGEGGAIVGNDNNLVARARWWCSRAPCRGGGLWRVYEHEAVGQNFRLPEMLGAVGCAAAEMFPVVVERKRAIRGWYEQHMRCLPDVQLQACRHGDEPVWWINAMLVPDGMCAEEVGIQLTTDYPDIEIRPGFFPLHNMTIFQCPSAQACPNTNLLFQRIVCLPSSVHLKEPDVSRICVALGDSLKKWTMNRATTT